eukprot:Em0001g1423a
MSDFLPTSSRPTTADIIIATIKGIAPPHHPPDMPLSTLNNSAILDQLQCLICLELLCQPLELPCRALKNIRIGDYNIHDCDAKPTKDEVKMASQVLSKLAATSPDKTISIPTDGLQSSSFSAYCVELHKLQMLKAKYAECKDELADLEKVMTYVAVCLGKDESITNNFLKQVNKKKQSVQKMEKEIASQSNAVEKGFNKHERPFVQGLDTALQSFKVKRQQYFNGVFVGNHIHKVLKWHMRSAQLLLTQYRQTAEKFTTVFSLLGRCPSIYDQLFINELKVTE